MAEHEFTPQERKHFRDICQGAAAARADANFPTDCLEKHRWYEEAWRRSYAAYVGEEYRIPCKCCGR